MRKVLLLLPFAALVLFSCQKEIDPGVLGTASGGSGSNGGSGGGTSSASYHPLTAGSYWKYQDSATSAPSSEKIIAKTLVKNGVTYTGLQAVNTSRTDTIYAASPRPVYYYYESASDPSGVSVDLLFNYLNDTASVGYTWQYTAGQGNGFTSYIKGTIMERNISMVVAGKTYTNVIHTHLLLSYDVLGFIIDAGDYDYYVAKGVGIIRLRTYAGPIVITNNLVDYHIQ